ncbi:MAG: cytochrome c biogenesis protein CcsA [Prevotella sp.]|nr:cytochrome c biogenesis protein CcsA [Prevotella sp.]
MGILRKNLFHIGLLIVLMAGTMAGLHLQRAKMAVVVGIPEQQAVDGEHAVVNLPFSVELQQFVVENYADGSPKRYASELQIRTKTGESLHTVVEVNKPATVEGWRIYQYSYAAGQETTPRSSILELVRDPWQPAVYLGAYLLLAGAVLLLMGSVWGRHSRLMVALLAVLAVVYVAVFKLAIEKDTLQPALQSPWFGPHVVAYMLAYTFLGIATVMAVVGLVRKKSRVANFIDDFVGVGLAFMTVGMTFGAFWAEEAWGHYWTWDPKETWAAITWFAYLAYVHYRKYPRHRPRVAHWLLIFAFVLLQICWWGVKYLPSAQGSLHVYN